MGKKAVLLGDPPWLQNRQVLLMATECHWDLLWLGNSLQNKRSPFFAPKPKIPASLVLTGFIKPRD